MEVILNSKEVLFSTQPSWIFISCQNDQGVFLAFFGAKPSMMVNLVCQVDWATGCAQIFGQALFWVFLDEMDIYISRLSKADCPP